MSLVGRRLRTDYRVPEPGMVLRFSDGMEAVVFKLLESRRVVTRVVANGAKFTRAYLRDRGAGAVEPIFTIVYTPDPDWTHCWCIQAGTGQNETRNRALYAFLDRRLGPSDRRVTPYGEYWRAAAIVKHKQEFYTTVDSRRDHQSSPAAQRYFCPICGTAQRYYSRRPRRLQCSPCLQRGAMNRTNPYCYECGQQFVGTDGRIGRCQSCRASAA